MRTLKKYIWVLLFNILSAAIIFILPGIYIYVKFGFTSEVVHVGVKVSVMFVLFLVMAGLYLLSSVKRWLKNIKNWIVRFVAQTVYYVSIVGGVVFLICKLCDTIDQVSGSILSDITQLTSATTYACLLFLACFVLSRGAQFFAAWFKSKIEDMEALKSVERAEKEREKIKKRAKKREAGIIDE